MNFVTALKVYKVPTQYDMAKVKISALFRTGLLLAGIITFQPASKTRSLWLPAMPYIPVRVWCSVTNVVQGVGATNDF
jgi:hypothetical protein